MTQTQINPDWLTGHGSPTDRGSADAYYGRPCVPHYWPDGTYKGVRVSASDMTDEQKNAYRDAYYSEDNRKDWG